GTTFSIYGTVEPKIITETNESGDDSTELDDEDSTLGFVVENRFSESVTGFAQIELEFSSDDNSNGFDQLDSAFLGVKGDFGKVQAGNFDSVYEDLIIDATEVAEDAEITDEAFADENNQLAYYSPDWNGFSFRTQARLVGRDDARAAGDEDDNKVGFSIAGGYTGNNWGLYAGYDDREAEATDEFSDGSANPEGDVFVGESTYGVSGIYGIGQFEFGAKYAIQNNLDTDPAGDDTTFTALRVTFIQGRSEFYAAVQRVDEDAGGERDEVTIGASHKLYSSLSVWAEAGQYDRPQDEGDHYMIGAIYSF
ncbi:MAG: porin, partial [Oleiphilaceae bacterium]|nr:porin [Oleiphilaceae bacterium]